MQFEIYLVAKAKDEKTDKLKVNMLLYCAGPEAIQDYSHFVFNTVESNECEGERIDNFVSELKRLSLTCEFGDLRDSLIRDRIVGGVLSDELRGEIFKSHADLTLQSAHDYCRTFEAAEQQKFKFHVPTSAGTERLSGQGRATARRCKFCGYKHPFNQPNKCPAFGKKMLEV